MARTMIPGIIYLRIQGFEDAQLPFSTGCLPIIRSPPGDKSFVFAALTNEQSVI